MVELVAGRDDGEQGIAAATTRLVDTFEGSTTGESLVGAECKPSYRGAAQADIKESGACGLWRGGASTPGDLSWWPCAHESRACVHAGPCWVDKYASYSGPPNFFI